MDKKEFLDLRNKLQQFEEEHSLELITEKETQSLNIMISVMTDYITHIEELPKEPKGSVVFDEILNYVEKGGE